MGLVMGLVMMATENTLLQRQTIVCFGDVRHSFFVGLHHYQ